MSSLVFVLTCLKNYSRRKACNRYTPQAYTWGGVSAPVLMCGTIQRMNPSFLSSPRLIVRFSFVLIVTIYFFSSVAHPETWRFLDAVDLVLHEAGHTILFFAGDFLNVLAGSLFQVLIPLIFVFYFFTRQELLSGSLVLFWVGQSMVNVSVYARDAVAQQLPLLGGDGVIHDWNYLLSTTGLLPHTAIIGSFIYWCGVVVIIAAAALAFHAVFYVADRPAALSS